MPLSTASSRASLLTLMISPRRFVRTSEFLNSACRGTQSPALDGHGADRDICSRARPRLPALTVLRATTRRRFPKGACRRSRLPGGAQAPSHLDGGSNGIFVKAKTEMAAAVIRVLNTIELWKLSDSVERFGIENQRSENLLKLD